MFELRMEVTLQLRFAFVYHRDVFLLGRNYVIYWFDVATFLMTLELRFILVRSKYVWK